jgi:hypothetical protein
MSIPAGALGLRQGLARRLLPLTLAIGLLLSLGVPATYYLIGSHSLQRTATVYAEEFAERLGEFVFNAPTLWKYQAQKYLQLLHQFVPHKELVSINIIDEASRSISEYTHTTAQSKVWWNRSAPMGSAPIRFNNRQVGGVQIQMARDTLLRTTLLLLLCSTTVGVGLALLLYHFPTKVVGEMETQIRELLEASQRSQAESEARRQTAEALAAVGHDLSEALDHDVVAQRIVDSVRALVGVQLSVLYRLEPASGDLVTLVASGPLTPAFSQNLVLPRGTGLSGLAVQERCPMTTPDVFNRSPRHVHGRRADSSCTDWIWCGARRATAAPGSGDRCARGGRPRGSEV